MFLWTHAVHKLYVDQNFNRLHYMDIIGWFIFKVYLTKVCLSKICLSKVSLSKVRLSKFYVNKLIICVHCTLQKHVLKCNCF